MKRQINPLPLFLQKLLLYVYAVAYNSGILSTHIGNAVFETSYHFYKDWLEAKTVNQLRAWVEPNSTVIDVGANAGFFSRRFAKWLNGAGNVIAIEPEAQNICRLNRLVSKEKNGDQIDIIQAVAADMVGELKLAVNPIHPGDHKICDQGILVEAITLDSILQSRDWPNVSLVKIDVQGAEVRVLDGAYEMLRYSRPVLFIEVDPSALNEQGFSVQNLSERLDAADYKAFLLGKRGHLEKLKFSDLNTFCIHNHNYIDILCLPSERIHKDLD